MVQLHFEKDNSTKHITTNAKTVGALLKELKINPETVLIARNNEVITEDEKITAEDKLEILSVISGG